MRDILTSPITPQDVHGAIIRGAITAANKDALYAMQEDDAISLSYLRTFIEDDMVKNLLHRHLEEQQPKPYSPDLEKLTKQELEKLIYCAIGNPYHRGRPDEVEVRDFIYCGTSSRHHVYVLNPGQPDYITLYVRLDKWDGKPRGEVNKSNFEFNRLETEPQPVAPEPKVTCWTPLKNDEPCSVLGRGLSRIKAEWQKLLDKT